MEQARALELAREANARGLTFRAYAEELDPTGSQVKWLVWHMVKAFYPPQRRAEQLRVEGDNI